MLKSITLLGSSSGRNAGDAALLSGIMDSVDHACQTRLLYEIPTIKPGFIRKHYNNRVRPISMLPWRASIKMLGVPTYRTVMRSDLTLVFDAILFDRALYNPLFNFLSTLHLLLPRAKKRGKRMGFFNVGAGPVTTPAGRRMLRELSDIMDFITVRDKDSFDMLRDLGVSTDRMLLTADAALNVSSCDSERIDEIFAELKLNPNDEILGININTYLDTWSGAGTQPLTRERFLEVYSAGLTRAVRRLRVPVLFVVSQHQDVGITKELMDRLDISEPMMMITNRKYNHHELKGVLSRITLLFAMRLHAMILASSAHTPIVGLAYQPKCEYYFRTLGLPEHSMSFSRFSEEAIADYILKGWEERAAIRAALDARIPVLQKEAFKAAELVAAMHRDEPLEPLLASFRQQGA